MVLGALMSWIAVAVVCGCESPGPAEPREAFLPPPDTAAGRVTFVASCAGCHASRDGYDLAYFGFPDSTIERRALHHVGRIEARDIAAYVGSLGVTPVGRGARPFQPGARVVAGDVEFARALFGEDAWPAGLTAAELRAIDPLDVAVGVPMPRWSDEATNRDWMPDSALPNAVLEHAGGAPLRALAAYYESRSDATLDAALGALVAAAEDGAVSAPCARDGGTVRDAAGCFQILRWVSAFAAQHLLREGSPRSISTAVRNVWWATGDAARANDDEIANANENRLAWLHLAWTFERGNTPSDYLGNAYMKSGMPRHAAFVALRSLVEREPGHFSAYSDLGHAAKYLPASWAAPALTMALDHLKAEVDRGYAPAAGYVPEVVQDLDRAFGYAKPKVSATDYAALDATRRELMVALGAPQAGISVTRDPTERFPVKASRKARRLTGAEKADDAYRR